MADRDSGLTLSDLVAGNTAPEPKAPDTSSWRRIPVIDVNGNPHALPVPPDMPKAQLHAIMRDNDLKHYSAADIATTTTPATQKPPGWLGSAWEGAKEEVIDPFIQGAKEVSGLAFGNPNALRSYVERVQQPGGIKREALRQAGNVGGVVTPFIAPEAALGSVAGHTLARGLGASEQDARYAGLAGGLIVPGGRLVYEGGGMPFLGDRLRQTFTRIGEAGTGEFNAARDAAQRTMNGVITEADARGVQMTPAQRQALASQLDNLNVSRGTTPTIDEIQTELLDPNRTVRMSDLDRYHNDIRTRLPLQPTYSQTQRAAAQEAIRGAQGDILQPHADLAEPWTDALGTWGREIVPSGKVVAPVTRSNTTFERQAMSPRVEQQQRLGQGVPGVNEQLSNAQRIVNAQRGVAKIGPIVGPLVAGSIGAGGGLAGGQRDPWQLGADALALAAAEKLAEHGRIGAATPAGRQLLTRTLPFLMSEPSRMTPAR